MFYTSIFLANFFVDNLCWFWVHIHTRLFCQLQMYNSCRLKGHNILSLLNMTILCSFKDHHKYCPFSRGQFMPVQRSYMTFGNSLEQIRYFDIAILLNRSCNLEPDISITLFSAGANAFNTCWPKPSISWQNWLIAGRSCQNFIRYWSKLWSGSRFGTTWRSFVILLIEIYGGVHLPRGSFNNAANASTVEQIGWSPINSGYTVPASPLSLMSSQITIVPSFNIAANALGIE